MTPPLDIEELKKNFTASTKAWYDTKTVNNCERETACSFYGKHRELYPNMAKVMVINYAAW